MSKQRFLKVALVFIAIVILAGFGYAASKMSQKEPQLGTLEGSEQQPESDAQSDQSTTAINSQDREPIEVQPHETPSYPENTKVEISQAPEPSKIPQDELTPEEAARVVPINAKISLTAKKTSGAILLEWKSSGGTLWNHYDVYRRMPDTIGWGERIARLDVVPNSLDVYSYSDKQVAPGNKYEYQIIAVKLSGGYEVKDTASNAVEVQR